MAGITHLRIVQASIISAVLMWIVPVAIAYADISMSTYSKADGTPDNAPIRGLGILIILLPVLIVVTAGVTWLIAITLQRLGRLHPRSLATLAVMTSAALSTLMVLGRPFGWSDKFYYFAGFLTVTLTTTCAAALVWWKVATR